MELKRSGSQSSAKGPAEYFSGNVRIDPLFQATDPSRVSAALVTFEPGARTAWHTHPLGQRLIVTAGCGCSVGAVLRASSGLPSRRSESSAPIGLPVTETLIRASVRDYRLQRA